MGFWSGLFNNTSGDLASDAKKLIKQGNKAVNKLFGDASTVRDADRLAENLDKLAIAHDKYDTASGKDVNKAKREFQRAYNKAEEGFKGAMDYLKDAKSTARGQRVGKVLKSKLFLIPAAIATVTVVGAKMISNKNKRAREELVENREKAIAAQQADNATLRDSNKMMGLDPTPGDIAAGVIARRNGVAAGVDHSNPNMTAGNFEAVR